MSPAIYQTASFTANPEPYFLRMKRPTIHLRACSQLSPKREPLASASTCTISKGAYARRSGKDLRRKTATKIANRQTISLAVCVHSFTPSEMGASMHFTQQLLQRLLQLLRLLLQRLLPLLRLLPQQLLPLLRRLLQQLLLLLQRLLPLLP